MSVTASPTGRSASTATSDPAQATFDGVRGGGGRETDDERDGRLRSEVNPEVSDEQFVSLHEDEKREETDGSPQEARPEALAHRVSLVGPSALVAHDRDSLNFDADAARQCGHLDGTPRRRVRL